MRERDGVGQKTVEHKIAAALHYSSTVSQNHCITAPLHDSTTASKHYEIIAELTKAPPNHSSTASKHHYIKGKYRVATISRLLKIIDLFCKRAL